MAKYDRIDLVAIGTWAKNFRPTGLVLTFGTGLTGGDVYQTLSNVVLPYGSRVGSLTLSASVCGAGTIVPGGVFFTTVADVVIPYGTRFALALTIGGKAYAKGVFAAPDDFLMHTIQLVDINGKAIFSVHGIKTDELITFPRPTADIRRLIMYRDGVGVDAAIFACYNIVFKTAVTLADITNFNKTHPSDLNPIIIDDGTALNSSYLIPV